MNKAQRNVAGGGRLINCSCWAEYTEPLILSETYSQIQTWGYKTYPVSGTETNSNTNPGADVNRYLRKGKRKNIVQPRDTISRSGYERDERVGIWEYEDINLLSMIPI